jgi:hypothetical protein
MKHQLTDYLAIAICADHCGAQGWDDIEIMALVKTKVVEVILHHLYGSFPMTLSRRVL